MQNNKHLIVVTTNNDCHTFDVFAFELFHGDPLYPQIDPPYGGTQVRDISLHGENRIVGKSNSH